MITFCRGEHCPVRNQCTKHKEFKTNPVFECDVVISNCRNQRLFTNND